MSKLRLHERYATTPNSLLNREDISFKAKGIFTYLQSKPDGWEFSAIRIAYYAKEGEKSVRSGIQELEEKGYLRRYQNRSEDGTMDGYDYELFENPRLDCETPSADNPSADNRRTVPEVEKSPTIYIKKDTQSEIVESQEPNWEEVTDEELSELVRGVYKSSASAEIKRRRSEKPKIGQYFTKKKYLSKPPKPISLHPSIASISETNISDLASKHRIKVEDVKKKLEDLRLYCASNSLTYSDYLAKLESFIIRDINNNLISPIKSNVQIMLEEGIAVKINNKWVTSFDEYVKEYKIWEAEHENN